MSEHDEPELDPARWAANAELPRELRALFEARDTSGATLAPPPLASTLRDRLRVDLLHHAQSAPRASTPKRVVGWSLGVLAAAAAIALVVWQWPLPPDDARTAQPIERELPDGGPSDAAPSDAAVPDAGPLQTREILPNLEIEGNGCGLDLRLALDNDDIDDDIASIALVLREHTSAEARENGVPADCVGRVIRDFDGALFRAAGDDGLLGLSIALRPPDTHCDGSYTVTVCARDSAGRLATRHNATEWPTATSNGETRHAAIRVSTPSGPVALGDLLVDHAITSLDVRPPTQPSWTTPYGVPPEPVEARVLRRPPFEDSATGAIELRLRGGRIAQVSPRTRVYLPREGVFRAASELVPGEVLRGEDGLRPLVLEEAVSRPDDHEPDQLDVSWPNTLFVDGVLVHDAGPDGPSSADVSPIRVVDEPVRALPVTNRDCSLRVELEIGPAPPSMEAPRSISVVYAPHRGRAGHRVPVDCTRARVGAELPASFLRLLPEVSTGVRRVSVELPAWDSEMGDWHPSGAERSVPRGPAIACDSDYAVLACVRDAGGTLRAMPSAQGRWAHTGPSCFAEGTLIATPDGERPIESLTRGERVVTIDERTGERLVTQVTALLPRGERAIVELRLSSGTALRVTAEHPLYDARARVFRPADELRAGDVLLGCDGHEVSILERLEHDTRATVYDLSVGAPHTYLAAGVLAHNY